LHRLDRPREPRRARARAPRRVDGRDDAPVPGGLPRAPRTGGLRPSRGGGSLRRVAAPREGEARDLPGTARRPGRAPPRDARPRLRAAVHVLRRADRGRQARRRPPQRKRLRSSLSPRSRVFVDGATLIEGDAGVPVTFALTSPRPWLTTMSRFMRPLASRYSPATATFMIRLTYSRSRVLTTPFAIW